MTGWRRGFVSWADGSPDVAGLSRSTIVHGDGSPYIERYDLIVSDEVTVRLHHWLSSDDQHAPHDHPWPNVTTVLTGELVEVDVLGLTTELTAGSVVTRRAADAHMIQLVSSEAWTLFMTGRIERRWGFATDRGWVHWKQWPHSGRVRDS